MFDKLKEEISDFWDSMGLYTILGKVVFAGWALALLVLWLFGVSSLVYLVRLMWVRG